MSLRKFFILIISSIALNFHAHSSALLNTVLPKVVKEIPKDKKEQMLRQMKWFANLTPAEYKKLTGKRLNFFEKISLKINQHRVKQMLNHYNWDEPTTLQKISWLIKGLILGPIALLLGYIFLKDDDRELIKWVWFGFAGWVVILVLFIIAYA